MSTKPMKKKTFTFDSEKIGLHKFIHFQGNPEINFSKESTKVVAYFNNSIKPYFIDYVERYIRPINPFNTSSFNIPIPINSNQIKIVLFGLTDYDIDKIDVNLN